MFAAFDQDILSSGVVTLSEPTKKGATLTSLTMSSEVGSEDCTEDSHGAPQKKELPAQSHFSATAENDMEEV